jgi:hypothetical protein
MVQYNLIEGVGVSGKLGLRGFALVDGKIIDEFGKV